MNKDLIKKFGEGAFITGDQLCNYNHNIIHVSPTIDFMLGGGIPGGCVVTIAGPPKCGKTIKCLHILGKAQKIGRPTYYINAEGRIKERDIKGIACLDITKLNIVRSYRTEEESKIFSAEEFLQVVEYIIHNVPGAVIVIDSVSQLATTTELEKDIGEVSRAPGAVLMAQFCKKVSNVIPVNDIILIGILHFIANTSGFGKSLYVSGGNKIRYAMDIGMECNKFTFRHQDGKDDGPIVGQDVYWTTSCAALAPPVRQCRSIIEYGIGVDELAELVTLGVEYGFIEQKGAWYTIKSSGEKFQGINNLTIAIRNDAKLADTLHKNVYELLFGVVE